ncbi:MAG: response regulator transcription factor [Clostridia bacterium]|nr:response regulator transcription factor [Clostridia bacterium]
MIWLVEDDAGVRDIEVYALESTGFDAMGFEDGPSFFEALKKQLPDLIILDVMLPGMDGVDILRRLKSSPDTSSIPVIMATAKGQEYDKVKALDLGADDYLVKPFGMMEMVSRVKAVLRRSGFNPDNRHLKVGGIEVDMDMRTVSADGQRVELTLKEFEVLREIISHPGMVFTRDRLLTDIWGDYYDGETRTVDVHIQTLRSKLGQCAKYIKTVRGVGYKAEE